MVVHFIAIGGSVMHQLAVALKAKGYIVSGSDDEIFVPARSNLEEAGILPPAIGWFPGKINPEIDAVILGMHARADNPELEKARQIGLKIYSFPEYIFQESTNKIRIAVGGSHGKTTTTAMIMHILKYAGENFDYLVGARLQGFDNSVRITDAPVIVCEADEYPASVIEKRPKFHFLHPQLAVITGIAWDHINVFPTFEFYLEQFKIFIDTIQPGGILIYNQGDEELNNLVKKNKRSDIRYQPYRLPGHQIENGKTQVIIDNVRSAPLKIFGNHNLLNLQASYWVCKELKLSTETILAGIAEFAGASKRLELLTETGDCTVFRDFAHAPSKVKATIEAVKQQFPKRKLIAVLELHTFSSLNENFMNQYQGTMEPADEAVVFYSRHALELKRMPELPKEKVKEGFAKNNLEVITEKKELEKWLHSRDYSNSNLLLMSSGNYDGLDVGEILKEIRNKE